VSGALCIFQGEQTVRPLVDVDGNARTLGLRHGLPLAEALPSPQLWGYFETSILSRNKEVELQALSDERSTIDLGCGIYS